MKEHPILFSGEMVRAILEGRKTQTRRVINPQPIVNQDGIVTGPPEWTPEKGIYVWNVEEWKDISAFYHCPYGKPGDRLWVRETWGLISPESAGDERWYSVRHERAFCLHPDSNPVDGMAGALYRVDGEWTFAPGYQKWRPSIFMPRWASRITLEVTGVRVERVQEISPFDCQAEGIIGSTKATPIRRQPYEEYSCGDGLIYTSPRDAFRALWDEINGDRGFAWDSNPWVWVVEFRRAE